MVKCVHREPSAGMAIEARDQRRLHIGRLDLDVHGRARADPREHSVQRRDARAIRERDVLKVGPRTLGDGQRAARRRFRGPGAHHRVMMHDDDAVSRGVHVELDPVRALREGAIKRGHGVFEALARRAPMGDDLWDAHDANLGRETNWSAAVPAPKASVRPPSRWKKRPGRPPCSSMAGRDPDAERSAPCVGQAALNTRERAASNHADRMTEPEREDEAALDRALVEQWQAGDQRAATRIVERHAAALARFAVRLGMSNEAEELVQDTFVRAFGALDAFRSESSLRTWLFTIERRLVIDRRRSAARRGTDIEVEDEHAATGYDALDALVADETSRRVSDAMTSLTRMQREVFTLRVQEGRSYKEIAEILDTSEGAARVHYHNAMRAVKEFLDD